ncbi:hypothetical protein L3073_06510 [Ancylomarina sp. DW003]|nr:hypothetical protein [Ancylomarina sp. DW003]MDE5421853.1 hypothetical protein [Ancylomarina sp. DW003]
MKISKYLLLLALPFIFFSCDEESDDFASKIENGELYRMDLSVKNPTTLDTKFEVVIDAYEVFDKLEVTYNGTTTKLGEVTLTSGAGTFEDSYATIGLTKIGDSETLDFIYTNANGIKYIQTVDVELVSPFAITNVSGVIQDNMEHYLKFKAGATYATLTDLTLSAKVSDAGTYAEIVDKVYTVADDSILFKGMDYNVGDTVFVKFDAVLGTKTHSETVSFVVNMAKFANESEAFMLDTESEGFDLMKMVNVGSDEDEADLTFVLGMDNMIGFSSNNAMYVTDFVKTDKALYTSGDMVKTMADYEAGTKLTSITDVDVDDVYIYMTYRKDVDDIDGDDDKDELIPHYGLLMVSSVDRTNNNDDDGFMFKIKY